ncbi:hypothetical protein GCM10019059_39390 [Camelimonas fluminis]|nr:hypothetical protein GCM10019059_39390 [Camelimonas fluminis]
MGFNPAAKRMRDGQAAPQQVVVIAPRLGVRSARPKSATHVVAFWRLLRAPVQPRPAWLQGADRVGQPPPCRASRPPGGRPGPVDDGHYDGDVHVQNLICDLRAPTPRLPSCCAYSGGLRRS